MAYLDKDLVNNIFQENLLEVPELTDTFLKILGLKGYKPFECIGEIGEAKLAMYYCMLKGMSGKVIDIFKKEILPHEDFKVLFDKYSHIYDTQHSIPKEFEQNIFQQFKDIVKPNSLFTETSKTINFAEVPSTS